MLELALSIALHSGLGLVLAVLVWLVGAGVLALAGRPLDPGSLLDAYPLGLLVIMAAATLTLLWLPAGVAALVAVIVLAARGVSSGVTAPPGLPLGGAAALAFGAGLGVLTHGPTDELDSAAYGGMLWYVDKVVSATQSIVPFRDLLAEGERMIYAEAGTSFVGATLSALPGFDAILYHGATLPAFAAASVCIGLALFGASRDTPIAPPIVLAAAALVGVAVFVYPSWVTETPPAAFALPLAFSLWRLWREELGARWLALLAGVVALDYFSTKVVGIMALGLLLVAGLVERNRGRPDFRRLVAIGATVLALGAAVVVGLLFAFASWYAGLSSAKNVPLDALRGVVGDDADVRSLGLLALVAGELVLLAALVRARVWGLAAALAVTLLPSWFLAGYGFDIALGGLIFVAALTVLAERRSVELALGAGVLLAAATALREVFGAGAGLALTAALVAAVGAPLAARRLERRGRALAAVAAAVLVAVPLAAAAADPAVAVTTDDRDIWRAVHERVPEDGLVFTSLTGLDVTPHAGWNNYPSTAGRQVFIAGWYDGRLVSHPEDRDAKLRANRAVLTGATRADAVDVDREYDAYFAVVRRTEDVPPSFRRVHENDSYALYEIP